MSKLTSDYRIYNGTVLLWYGNIKVLVVNLNNMILL